MVIYMTRIMGYEPAFASVQLMLFEGTCYLTPILGAWLADSAWGRFKTILVFSIIYFIVSPQPTPSNLSWLYLPSFEQQLPPQHCMCACWRQAVRQHSSSTSTAPLCCAPAIEGTLMDGHSLS